MATMIATTVRTTPKIASPRRRLELSPIKLISRLRTMNKAPHEGTPESSRATIARIQPQRAMWAPESSEVWEVEGALGRAGKAPALAGTKPAGA